MVGGIEMTGRFNIKFYDNICADVEDYKQCLYLTKKDHPENSELISILENVISGLEKLKQYQNK